MDTVSPPEFPALSQDTEAEICVIGAGIAGLTTAYLLAKKGVAVIVLDDRHIGGGETERTTAHLSNELDDRYTEAVRIHGDEKAVKIARSHTDAIGMIATIVREEKIDCDFRRIDGYLFPGEGQEESMLDEELEAAHQAGLLDVHKLDAVPLPAAVGPGLRFPDQAQFHPTKYLEGLARAIEKHGGKIYTRTHVSKIEEDEQPVKIHTDNNALVFAQKVIVATNAPINDNVHIYTKQAPYRTFVVGIQIPRDSVQPGLYWDMLDPYHYVRTQPLDTTHDVLIVGGEDHRSGTEDDMPARLDRLEAWTKKRLGISGKRLYGWSGQVMETMDGLALIGQLPGAKEWSFIATGDSGMGMTHGTIAGMILSSLATGSTHPWAEIYDPARFRLKATTEFIKENVGTGAALIGDWVKPGEVSDPEKIAPGSGAVIRKGVSKIALYRDPAGAFHACSAVCPHKGCVVQWNDGEKSWDCPCHGSRYDATGKVVNGPSLKDLAPAEDWNN